jgi:predicted DNA-binding transcriptional regulator YafY
MSALERAYRMERLLREQRAVSMDRLRDELGVSRATIKRDLAYLRDRLNAPVVWDRSLRGYRLEGGRVLPALYLSTAETQSLLVLQQLVARVHPAVAQRELAGLRGLLTKLGAVPDQSMEELARRVRILQLGARPVAASHFEAVTAAVLGRRRLMLTYYTRARDEETVREVSPHRLVHYRDNWYLDAWCHLREGLRSFALDAIRSARICDEPAIEIPDEQLDRELGSGYGIFSGVETRIAVLRFTPLAARWVAQERWHSEQRGEFDAEGSYILKLPYAHDRELVCDILRHGADVEVLAPEELRVAVRRAAAAVLNRNS